MKLSILRSNTLCKYGFAVSILFASHSSFSQQAWARVPTPDTSETRNLLSGIAGTSSSDVWVVGEFEATPAGNLRNLIMHYDGNEWQIIPGTDLSSTYNDLWGVTAITSNNVWAAGTYNDPGTSRSQLLHWNGQTWTHTSLPNIEGGSFLFSIDAISANDIWAVGGQAGSPTDPTYTIHYDGNNWVEVAAANPGTYRNWFDAVDGIASDDVWAVGRLSNSYGDFHAMAQHWDGSSWSNSTLPSSVVTPLGELESVTMISSNDVWAIGSTVTGLMLLIHWDGTNWTEVSSAGCTGGKIIARGTDVFAVGDRISQWNGSSWVVIDSLNQLSYPSLVSAVTFSNGDIWAAGRTYDTSFHTLVYRTVAEPLPVIISDYSISKTGATATIKWSTVTEFNAREFVIERSADMLNYTFIDRIAAHGTGSNYKLVDTSPGAGLNYYRLKLIDWDARETFFPVKSLFFKSEELENLLVYPNPVSDGMFNVRINADGDGILSLYDHLGQQVMSWDVSSGQTSFSINLRNKLAPGEYIISLIREEIVWSEKIFIK